MNTYARWTSSLVVLAVLSALRGGLVWGEPLTEKNFSERPKLVLVLVVDQMRGDYLTRFRSRFLEPKQAGGKVGGFRYLTSFGAYYPFAQYDVFQNMTGPGHAMIMSGSYPYQMGISLNTWYEPGVGPLYCVGDSSSPLVTESPKPKGLSPKNFRGTTVGDELKNSGHDSRVVSIALKDRAAILLGGHRADLALWFDAPTLQWTTSRYYLKTGDLPHWVQSLSEKIRAKKGQKYEWKSLGVGNGLSQPRSEGFTHTTEYGSYDSLSYPMGIELTVEAAKAALVEMRLGHRKSPDLLAVSFSSHDYLAHAHGLNSRELEELTVFEDQKISELLNLVRTQTPGGLENVLIVLTADHGGPPHPDWIQSAGMNAGRIDEEAAKATAEDHLRKKFGAAPGGLNYIAYVSDLNFFLDPQVLQSKKLETSLVEQELKQSLLKTKGILAAFTKTEHRLRQLPPNLFERQISKGYQPSRSGDVVLIPLPHFQSKGSPVDHQTGYSYDRSVPLILAGKKLKPGVYSQPADVVDIAPTLSFLLGTVAPAMSEGRVLSEILTNPK